MPKKSIGQFHEQLAAFHDAGLSNLLILRGHIVRTEVPSVNPSPTDKQEQLIWQSRNRLQAARQARELSIQGQRAEILRRAAAGAE
jgi:hypothetical protein